MKIIVALILLTAFATLVFSQNDCTSALSDQQFQKQNQQIKGIVELFDYENYRLEITKLDYDFTKKK